MTRHLIHVGYPKTGSTFLQEWFQQHPEFRYVSRGVAGFRSVNHMCVEPGGAFRYYVTSSEGLAAPHSSVANLRPPRPGETPRPPERFKEKQAEVCDVLRTLYPGSRILIVTRGFREMILSGYSEFVRLGGTLDPEGMCRALGTRLAEDEHHYLDYDYLVGLYLEAFGAENVILLPYELLRDDQRRFVAVLEETLGVDHAEIDIGRIHTSLSPTQMRWYPRLSRALSVVASGLGPAAARRLYAWYDARLYPAGLGSWLLKWAGAGRRITWEDFPDEILRFCEGKATRLRDHPLYAPYATEYLWREEAVPA